MYVVIIDNKKIYGPFYLYSEASDWEQENNHLGCGIIWPLMRLDKDKTRRWGIYEGDKE